MKINRMFAGLLGEGVTIAYFGEARLIRRLDSRFELRGGRAEDRSAAKEWISMFMHEAVLVAPGSGASKIQTES